VNQLLKKTKQIKTHYIIRVCLQLVLNMFDELIKIDITMKLIKHFVVTNMIINLLKVTLLIIKHYNNTSISIHIHSQVGKWERKNK
jgi:hypothetical protein